MRVCLQNGKIKWFDNNTHDCINNRIVERNTHSLTPMLTPTRLPPLLAEGTTTTKAKTSPSAADDKNSNILKCGSVHKARKSRGYKCCGYQPYHPDFETCCVQMVYHYKIHSGKRHKDHV